VREVSARSIHSSLASVILKYWQTCSSITGDFRSVTGRKQVHDLRTGLRRLTATLELVEWLWRGHPPDDEFSKVVRKLRKRLKQELGSLRDLRDFQAQEKAFDRRIQDSGLLAFHHSLQRGARKERRQVKRRLKSVHWHGQNKAIQAICARLKERGAEPLAEQRAKLNLERILGERYRRFERCANLANASAPATLHQARIEFKKFRYSWDALADLIPRSKSTEQCLKSLQEVLGGIQDSVVLSKLLIRSLVRMREERPSAMYLHYFHAAQRKLENEAETFFSRRHRLLDAVNPLKLSPARKSA
jgi:CHAD domain-containing protein